MKKKKCLLPDWITGKKTWLKNGGAKKFLRGEKEGQKPVHKIHSPNRAELEGGECKWSRSTAITMKEFEAERC